MLDLKDGAVLVETESEEAPRSERAAQEDMSSAMRRWIERLNERMSDSEEP